MTRTPPKHLLRWLIALALSLAVSLGTWRALDKRSNQLALAASAAAAALHAPVFQLSEADWLPVRRLELVDSVGFSGNLRAANSALVKARVAGTLSGLSKREGDSVRTGELLATVLSPDSAARERQLRQQAEAARAQVDIAQRTWENNQSLQAQGFISSTALDNARAQLSAAVANHQAALAGLAVGRQSVQDTQVRSPINGVLSDRLAQNGERVGVDARVVEVLDLSVFEIEAALPAEVATRLREGLGAQVRIEGLATPLSARIVRINPKLQSASRSVLVYLRLSEARGLRQGMFAQGEIELGRQNQLAVPLSSVRTERPQAYLPIVLAGQVQHHPVSQALASGHWQGEPMLSVPDLPEGTPVLRAQLGSLRLGSAVALGVPAADAGNTGGTATGLAPATMP